MTATVEHPLTVHEAATIRADLAEIGIPVLTAVDFFGTVHIWPGRPTTVLEEVTALRPFIAATDSRLAWHEVKA